MGGEHFIFCFPDPAIKEYDDLSPVVKASSWDFKQQEQQLLDLCNTHKALYEKVPTLIPLSEEAVLPVAAINTRFKTNGYQLKDALKVHNRLLQRQRIPDYYNPVWNLEADKVPWVDGKKVIKFITSTENQGVRVFTPDDDIDNLIIDMHESISKEEGASLKQLKHYTKRPDDLFQHYYFEEYVEGMQYEVTVLYDHKGSVCFISNILYQVWEGDKIVKYGVSADKVLKIITIPMLIKLGDLFKGRASFLNIEFRLTEDNQIRIIEVNDRPGQEIGKEYYSHLIDFTDPRKEVVRDNSWSKTMEHLFSKMFGRFPRLQIAN